MWDESFYVFQEGFQKSVCGTQEDTAMIVLTRGGGF